MKHRAIEIHLTLFFAFLLTSPVLFFAPFKAVLVSWVLTYIFTWAAVGASWITGKILP